MAVIFATLAHEIDGKIEYVYPKTVAELVEYDETCNVKEKIDSFKEDINNINVCIDNIHNFIGYGEDSASLLEELIKINKRIDGIMEIINADIENEVNTLIEDINKNKK